MKTIILCLLLFFSLTCNQDDDDDVFNTLLAADSNLSQYSTGNFSCNIAASYQCYNITNFLKLGAETLCTSLGGTLSESDILCTEQNAIGRCDISGMDDNILNDDQTLQIIYYTGGINITLAEIICEDANNPYHGTFFDSVN